MKQATLKSLPRHRSRFLPRLLLASQVIAGVAGIAVTIGIAWAWVVLIWAIQ